MGNRECSRLITDKCNFLRVRFISVTMPGSGADTIEPSAGPETMEVLAPPCCNGSEGPPWLHPQSINDKPLWIMLAINTASAFESVQNLGARNSAAEAGRNLGGETCTPGIFGRFPDHIGVICLRLLMAPVLVFCFSQVVSGAPYQLLESESAILIRKNAFEYKIDAAHDYGPIPTNTLKTQLRYGILKWWEVSPNVTYAQFPEQDEQRLAEYEIKTKFHVLMRRFYDLNLYLYLKYREALGDPVIVDFEGRFENVTQFVSPHADHGKDTTVGFLGRHSFRISRTRYLYMFGIAFTRAEGRDYNDFTEDQNSKTSILFAPEAHFLRNQLMFALENKYTYWKNRGDYYDAVPQVRWEFMPDWVLEAGISIPVLGGEVYRAIIGLTIETD